MDDLKVLFLASEAEPLVKVGGLGDVAGSLPQALRTLRASDGEPGVDIRLVIPFHPQLESKVGEVRKIATLVVESAEGPIAGDAYLVQDSLGETAVPIYLVDGLPIRESPYVYSDDAQIDGRKYVFFSLAALKLAEALDWWPDILHANDWHTSAAVYQAHRLGSEDSRYAKLRKLLAIHNLPYMGSGAEEAMDYFGLPPAEDPAMPWWAGHMPLPLGLLTADRIVAVSPGYAREIRTPEFGAGLEGLLVSRGDAVTGIINGIDMAAWDPETDPEIRMQYSLASLPARMRNKSALQEELNLPIRKSALFLASISRMVHQKGVDLIIEALFNLEGFDWQALILGTGEPHLEEAARALQARFPDRVRAAITYDPALTHRV
ncbi:MAG: glycogen/starch synthase [Anaerolineales bacterium]|nr:glycogen/starch synthase [Anaerolineales bacterium]